MGGWQREGERGAYGADRAGHFAHAHEHGEATATKCGDGEFVVDVAELCAGGEDADVVELGEEMGLHRGAEGVLCGEHGETVGIGAECAAELVVSGGEMSKKRRRERCDGLVVILSVLDVVSADDLDLAYVGVLLPLSRGGEGGVSGKRRKGSRYAPQESRLF